MATLLQKKIKYLLFFLVLTWLTFSPNAPFNSGFLVKAQCVNDGDFCTTAQNCPGTCSNGSCSDIADNCPAVNPPPAKGRGIVNPVLGPGLEGTTAVSLVQKFVPYFIQWGFVLGVVIFFFMFLIGAIKWISSSGDKQKLEEARGTITSALIGLVVLFAAYAIIKVIELLFNVSLLNFTIPTLGG